MTKTEDRIYYWPNGSGVKVSGLVLDVWDSGNAGGVLECRTATEAENYYRLLTEFDAFEIVECFCGWPDELDDEPDQIWESEPWEVAYSMTYAGRGMENVDSARLGELLVSHELGAVFEIIGVDLEQFRDEES